MFLINIRLNSVAAKQSAAEYKDATCERQRRSTH